MTQYCLSHNDINHVGYVHGDHDAALGPVVALLSESKQIGHNADNGKYDQVIDREGSEECCIYWIRSHCPEPDRFLLFWQLQLR